MVACAFQAMSHILQDEMYERHEQWMAHCGRVYKDTIEKEQRYKIFKENVAYIESFNNAANKPYKLSVNQFADLTNEDFKASRNRFEVHECSTKTTSFKDENVTAVPSTLDWRKKGAVTPIKDQGQCGQYQTLLGNNTNQMFSYSLFFIFLYLFIYFFSNNRLLLGIFSSSCNGRNYSANNWKINLFIRARVG